MAFARLSRDIYRLIGLYLNVKDLCNVLGTAKAIAKIVDWKECAKRIKPSVASICLPMQHPLCSDEVRRRWCIFLYNVRPDRKICGVCAKPSEAHPHFVNSYLAYVNTRFSVIDVPHLMYAALNFNVADYAVTNAQQLFDVIRTPIADSFINWKSFLVFNGCEPCAARDYIPTPLPKWSLTYRVSDLQPHQPFLAMAGVTMNDRLYATLII
jgi:hypothetical protein